MLMLNSKKGAFGAAIVIAVIAVAMVFGGVLYFFFVFKAHASLEAREEYIWNKVQEVPLDLLSMDIDGESFVSRMNKVYYADESVRDDLEQELRDDIDSIISEQLFYFLEGPQYPFEAVINIARISISKYLEGCVIETRQCETDPLVPTKEYCHCYCSSPDCGENADKKLNPGGKVEKYRCEMYDISECIYTTDTKRYYSAKYPFPLTFNGTDELVSELSYDAIEEK